MKDNPVAFDRTCRCSWEIIFLISEPPIKPRRFYMVPHYMVTYRTVPTNQEEATADKYIRRWMRALSFLKQALVSQSNECFSVFCSAGSGVAHLVQLEKTEHPKKWRHRNDIWVPLAPTYAQVPQIAGTTEIDCECRDTRHPMDRPIWWGPFFYKGEKDKLTTVGKS